MSRKSESQAPMDGWQSVAWRVSGVEQMCFKRSFEGNQGGRITDESTYRPIVPGSRCRDCKWVFVEVRGGVRPVQSGSSARAQCPQWLMPMQLTRKVSWCTSIGWVAFAVLAILWHTDRPTDHTTLSVTIGRIYVRSTAMQPKKI